MSKKDFLMSQLDDFNNQEKKADVKANAVAETNDTQNAVAEEKTYNYDEFNLPNPNPTIDLKGKRYREGEPLHTKRYSFQITEELLENLKYYREYAERKSGQKINDSVLMREALAKALKKEPRG